MSERKYLKSFSSKQAAKESLLSMRDNGMTNADIAKTLDVSLSSVLNYIGPLPGGVGEYISQRRGADKKSVRPEPVAPAPFRMKESVSPVSTLRCIASTTTMEGKAASYSVDHKAKAVEMTGVVNGILDVETLDILVEELRMIRLMITSNGIE